MKNISQPTVVKIVAFFTFFGGAAWATYFFVYLENNVGLKGKAIGLIGAAMQFVVVVMQPVWGILADKFGRKRMFVASLLFSSVLVLGFLLQGSVPFYVWMTIVAMSFICAYASLMDSIVFDFTKQYPKYSYGEIRLWSAIGWAVSSLVVGQVLRFIDLKNIFPIAGSVFLFCALIISFFYKPLEVQSRQPVTLRNAYKTFTSNSYLTVFYILLIFLGIGSPALFLFINVYLNEIGCTPAQIGWFFALQSFTEIPVFFYGRILIKKYGVKRLFLLSIALLAIRFYLFSVIYSPNGALLVSLMHGVTYALFWVTATELVFRLVPDTFKATGQSLIYAAFFGLGIGLGNLFMGILKDEVGMHTTMLWCSGYVMFIGIVYLSFFAFYRNKGLLAKENNSLL